MARRSGLFFGSRTKLEREYAILGLLLLAPTVLVFLAVIVYPLVSAIYLSLFSIYTPTLQGRFVGLANYRQLLGAAEFWTSLRNNVVWTVGTLALQVVLGILVALHAAPEHGLSRAGAQPGAVPVLRLDRGGRPRVAVALQRPLRHPEPPPGVGEGRPDADRLAGPDAERHDQRHPGRRVEVFPLRRHRGAGPAADDPGAALRGGEARRRRPGRPVLRRDAAAAPRGPHRRRAPARDLGLQGVRPDLPADRRRAHHLDADHPPPGLQGRLRPRRDGTGGRPRGRR